MLTILLLLITVCTCIVAIFKPWIGVCAYYLMALLSPQYIWPWVFDGLRISMAVSASSLLGFLLAIFSGKTSLSRLKGLQTYCLVGIWLLSHLSNILSPYSDYAIPSNMISPGFILGLLNTMILFYLISVTVIDDEKKLKYLSLVILGSTIYFVYWANTMYLSGQIWQHQIDGRLRGPGSIYLDTNAFALMFVVSMPFFFYIGHYFQNNFFKYGLWLTIPFLWHAIFLTGSRGGLLSLAVVSAFIAWRFKSKSISIAFLLALGFAVLDQGGTIMDRSEGTFAKQRSLTDEETLDPRIVSWKVGLAIISDYPLLGIGTGRFQQAAPEYNYDKGLVAHNTFIQYSSDSGLIAGILYLIIFYNIFKINRVYPVKISLKSTNSFLDLIQEATTTSLLGFFVGALFLNLMLFEPFYLLLAVSFITNKLKKEKRLVEPKVYSSQNRLQPWRQRRTRSSN